MPLLLPNHNGGTELVGCGPDPHGYPRSCSFLSGSKLSLLCTHGNSQRETGGISLEGVTQVACRNHRLARLPGATESGWKTSMGTTRDGIERSSAVPLSNAHSPCTGVLPELVSFLFLRWLFQLQCGGKNKDSD